ncbi:hypothetical protein SAMN05216226_103200 [Halovenus aranensis]|uniref:Archaeal histidine kinase 4TM domain-containing protein n=1 Tax=Halovenus aranensis TaxID=890420 RepID=A0A1G8TQL1_9EURY|nr:hypothetical protein [Halovenus aranensis]SDJ43866.1 hypothetical protein SAMN05216226_103200 [Halovenus aranensis]
MDAQDISAGGIMGAGFVLVVLQLFQGVQQLDGFQGTDLYVVFTFETVPFVVVSMALMYVGSWLLTRADLDEELPRVVAWGAGSVALFGSVAALLVFSLQVTLAGDTLEQAPYIVVNLVTVGALAGVLVGIYDARSRIRQRELQHERDRVELFANKAADINNYGRALNRSESVEEVSSLCLEAIQTFLGLTDLAFAVVNDEVHFVDDTTVGLEQETLTDLIRASREQEQATAVVHDDVAAMTFRVTDNADGTSVIVALTEDGSVGGEDVQLLEMLVSHAATALDRIHERQMQASNSR